jgi:hypothetical protein
MQLVSKNKSYLITFQQLTLALNTTTTDWETWKIWKKIEKYLVAKMHRPHN